MTCTLYLYKDSKIIPSKNFVVDSLEDYLSTLTTITILDYQFLRNDLNLFIKINKSQDYSSSLGTYNYNYLKVVQNGVSYYYFVLKKTQISQSTIGLELKLDTLNTYKWNTAFKISPRTRVVREHKERLFRHITSIRSIEYEPTLPFPSGYHFTGKLVFENYDTSEERITEEVSIYYLSSPLEEAGTYISNLSREDSKFIWLYRDSNSWLLTGIKIGTTIYNFPSQYIRELDITSSLFRNIDYLSEGIDIPLYKKELGLLTNKEDSTWNLVYHNDTDQAINCHCIPSNTSLFASIPGASTLTYTDFEDGVYYYFMAYFDEENNAYVEQSAEDNDGIIYNAYKSPSPIAPYTWLGFVVKRTGTTLEISQWNCILSGGGQVSSYGPWKTITSLKFYTEELYYTKSTITPITGHTSNIDFITTTHFSSSTPQVEPLDSLKDVDRVDPELIKIISIPYFPTNYAYDPSNNQISVDGYDWTYSTSEYNGYRLNNLNKKFVNTISSNIDNPFLVLDVGDDTISLSAYKNIKYESKLFHSDYYQPKFVYDSFGFTFGLERLDIMNWIWNHNEKFTFNFVMTSTINSKFLFSFPEYILSYSSEDYDNVLVVARNNEEPIYNSAYITYLRTAFRYDLKNLGYKTIERGMNYGSGTINNSISMTEEYLKADYGGMVSSGVSYIKSIFSSVFGAQKDRIALEAKMESLKAQANSVSGSDDLDLLDYYSGNRAKLCLYNPSERMKKLLFDLFYYYGYSTNETKEPSISSRTWFNFVSCELEFYSIDNNINDSCKEDIVRRYNEGATFLHMNKISDVKTWDFDQTRENWELNLLI